MASPRTTLDYHHLIPKLKTKSPAWINFGLPVNEQGVVLSRDVGICKICLKSVAAKGGSTTNLLGHLKTHHPKKYKEIVSSMKKPASSTVPPCFVDSNDPDNPPTANTAVEPPHKIQKTTIDYPPLDKNTEKRCTQAVAEFLATTLQPYNIVEHNKFTNMLKTLNPRYTLPGRKYFSSTAVPKLYNETVSKIKKILSEVSEAEMSITSDCWTSVTNTPFLSITVHFVSPDWELVNACLSCKHLDNNHTADNITEVFMDTMSEWGMHMKNIFFCVTDNSENIVKAVVDQLEVPHLSCFAHNINIGVNNALDVPELKKAVARLKCLQCSIAYNWKMKSALSKAQEALNMEQVDLPSACATWWSTAKLCNRYIKNQQAVCKMLLEYPSKTHMILERSEIEAIEDFVSATALLEDMTKTLSGDNYLTASLVLPLYARIKKDLAHKDNDSELLKTIKSEILKPLREKYHKTSMASELGIATLCDPRFRLKFLECPHHIKQTAIKKIVDMSSNSEQNSTECDSVSKKEKKGLAKFFDFDVKVKEETNIHATAQEKKAEEELNDYLSMPEIDYNDCPLLWWKVHRSSFPSLEKLARKYLAIPGTSVPSERVFSGGGSVITKQRASLKPKNAEMQIFLAQNIKFV